MSGQCNDLSTFSSFKLYVETLKNVTSANLTIDAMQPCRAQICQTLFGAGNADISGIGVCCPRSSRVWTELCYRS